MKRILGSFLVWRLFIILVALIGSSFLTTNIQYSPMGPWASFDGVHYISVARSGYVNQAVFFPLYPLAIKIFSFGSWYLSSGLFVSNLSFLIGLYFLYKLLRLDYSEKISFGVVICLLLFPTSFFFGAIYSESLFFLLLVLSFYLARKKSWFWAIVSASLLVITRVIGVFILLALFYEYYVQKKKFNFWTLTPSIGLIGYSIFNYKKWGDALYFIHAHSQLMNGRVTTGIILFPQTIFRYLKILVGTMPSQYTWWIALFEIVIFFLVSYLLYVSYKKKVRPSYLIFSFLSFLLPISSGTFSGLPRYALLFFPIYIAIFLMNKKLRFVYYFLSVVILSILVMYFTHGYFVA